VFKVEYAIEGQVPWLHEPTRRAGTVHVIGDYDEIAGAERQVAHGQMPQRPYVLVGQQYLADPTRSSGSHNPLYAYAHVPAAFSGDATAAIEAQIERFAPGFTDQILARNVRTTIQMAEHNPNYVGGDVVTGANAARQLVFRPRVALNPYSLGVPGVYLCSAATPPGAGAHGMCGYNAAQAALARLR
jgi:phytoene dehydrogenase-like protein